MYKVFLELLLSLWVVSNSFPVPYSYGLELSTSNFQIKSHIKSSLKMAEEAFDVKKCKVNVDDKVIDTIINEDNPQLVGSIDQGTSSSRFLIFTKKGQILASAQVEHTQIFPTGEDKVGWHEHDPIEIWNKTKECIQAVQVALLFKRIDLKEKPLAAIGITNQRETTIAWNARTGIPYHNAIVWDDLRTTQTATMISNGDSDRLRDKTGLPIASYFAGTKVRWLLDNVSQLKEDLKIGNPERDNVRFGTIDTWLVYQLTGNMPEEGDSQSNVGGLFLTDVTNASRWLLMDIHSLKWDKSLIQTVCGTTDEDEIPLSVFPSICPSSQILGHCSSNSGIDYISNVPIASILGDQQAALFGQSAFKPGQAKCTYGTGLFLMMNTQKFVPSTQGLLSTVGYQLGKREDGTEALPPVYALEGSVSHSGSVIQWLRDQLQIIDHASQSEDFASKVETNDGLYFVPAFAGLFAPYWRSDARGCIVGMTASHTKNHICRAALEATAYQARELFDAIYLDSGVKLSALKVDGGATANKLLMQFQADVLDANVVVPVVMETTAIGAAYAAGLAVGVWNSLDEIQALWAVDQVWEPNMDESLRSKYFKGWKKAVSKSFGWVDEDSSNA